MHPDHGGGMISENETSEGGQVHLQGARGVAQMMAILQPPASNHMQVAISSSIAELNSHRSAALKFLLSSFYYLFKITDHKQLNNL